MKNLNKILSVTLTVIAVMLSFSVVSYAEESELKFNKNGKFTILQIADTQDDRYLAFELPGFIEKAIELAQPDLIVFTGDTVENHRKGGKEDADKKHEGVTAKKKKKHYDKTLSNAQSCCEQTFSIIEEKGIPFALCQGNNDYSSTVENEDWMKIYSEFPHCLVKDESKDEDERIDYSLQVKSSDGKTVPFNIYMMDNGPKDGICDEQIEWFREKSDELKAENPHIKSFVFEHKPIADIGNLFTRAKFSDKGAATYGFHRYKLGENAHGYFEVMYLPGETTEEFTAWKEQGDVIGAYFGHIHSDGYTGTWDGINLGVTYGAQFAKSGPYGVRVLTLDENDIESYSDELFTYKDGKFTLQKDNETQPEKEKFSVRVRRFFAGLFS